MAEPIVGESPGPSGGLGTLTDLAELGAVMRHLPDPVVVTDDCGIVAWANDLMEELMEGSLDTWLGRSLLDAVHPDCGLAVINAVASASDRPRGEAGELIRIRLITDSGRVREVETRGSLVRVGDRDLLVNVLRAVDDRFDHDVHDGDIDRMRTLIEHSPAILMLLDSDFRIVSASGALARLLGHDNFLVHGRRLVDLVAPDHRSLVDHALRRMEMHVHLTMDLPDVWGGARHFDAHFADLRMDPNVGAVVATLTDVNDLKIAERRLRELADLDPLTGAFNRRAFTESLSAALGIEPDVGVLFIDLDRFKPINDVHGHAAGDAVLVAVVERLRRAVRGADLVGRLGGDEFAIGLIGDAANGVGPTIARIEAALSRPIEVGDAEVVVGASIGSATVGSDTTATADELIRRADAAMYRRKLADRIPAAR